MWNRRSRLEGGGICRSAPSRDAPLRHRGPDAQHVWVRPARPRRARPCAPEHHRSRRPAISRSRTKTAACGIVANGEFYDFERIRARARAATATCSARDPTARSRCTSTRIAARARCTRCAASSRSPSGTSATACCSRRAIASASSRSTTRSHDGTFYLASEVKALAALGVPLRWDRDALYDVHFVAHPPDRTLFAGIYQLPPGRYLLTDGEQVRVMPYWDWDYPHGRRRANGARRRAREWVERLRARVRGSGPAAAARRRAGRLLSERRHRFVRRARVRVAPVAAAAPRLHAVVRSRRLRRSRPRRGAGDALGRRVLPHRRPLRRISPITSPTRSITPSGRSLNAHAVAKYLLSRAVRDSGIKVVLTGEGSDEIFAGYPHFRRDLVLLRQQRLRSHEERARLLAELEAANRVVGRHAAAAGRDAARQRAARARLRAVEPRESGRRSAPACCASRATTSPRRYAGRDTFPHPAQLPRRRASARAGATR